MKPNLSSKAKRTCYILVRFVLVIFTIGVFLAQIGLLLVLHYAYLPVSTDVNSVDKIITIKPGMSGKAIAQLLFDSGLIIDVRVFNIMLRLTNTANRLQAGEYLLNPTLTTMEVIDKLRQGTTVTYRVVIPEGYNIQQIAKALADQGLVDQERFITLATNAELVYGDDVPLPIPISSLEGYLFPDTYRFVKGQGEESIIRQMVARFIDYALPQIDLSLLDNKYTLHEVITLASIVEKEVMVDWERPLVAAVYLNRLSIGMRLQADPTVRYVMTEDRGRVLYRDLEIDSPYNTYRYDGLPPGPIASPGIRSILAVLNPADVDYLYFVSKRDGTHQFSRTFEEHVAARRMLGY